MPTYYEVRPGSDPVRVSEEYVPAEVRADEPEPTELVPPGNDTVWKVMMTNYASYYLSRGYRVVYRVDDDGLYVGMWSWLPGAGSPEEPSD
jgi:hypothetical protein